MVKERDVILIYVEETPVTFARVEDIKADAKKDWFHIKLLMLQMPLQTVTWILKDRYINGEEFYMGGKRMRFEPLQPPEKIGAPGEVPFQDQKADEKDNPNRLPEGEAEIIPFEELKKSKSEDEQE